MLNEYSRRGHVNLPFGSIENGKLKKNSPINYIKLPFSKYSALIAKIEKRIMKFRSRNRENSQFEISKLIIEEMFKNAINNNAKFSVLILDSRDQNLIKYKNYFASQNINFIHCPFPQNKFVKGEGHPNSAGHQEVANCISEKLIVN